MKKTYLITIVLFAFFSCFACSSVDKEVPPPQGGSNGEEVEDTREYVLVWQDEFNNKQNGDGSHPLPSNEWWFEKAASGWVNNELQNYVDAEYNGLRVAEIKDGNLIITAHKLDKPLNGTDYISARMNTEKAWLYGKFEMRAKLPGGKGVWPAFWMLPKNFQSWPLDGEIDIMEYVGYDPNVIHASIHTQAYYHSINTQKTATVKVTNVESEYHIYALEWTGDEITGFVDGTPYFNFKNDKKGDKKTWPFNQPFYLKLNLAIGGDWGGAQGVDANICPAQYLIDYVRVYQKQ